MKNTGLIFAALGVAVVAGLAAASRGSRKSEESKESQTGDDWYPGGGDTPPSDSSQLGRLALAFQQAGVVDFTPEEFLRLRKWGVIADMPPEYEPNLVNVAVQAQALRDRMGIPLVIMNGYRSPEYNTAVGGAANSAHLRGGAIDIEVASPYATSTNDRKLLVESAKLWLTRTSSIAGLGIYTGGRSHLDVFHPGGVGRRSWGSGDLDGVVAQAKAELGQS